MNELQFLLDQEERLSKAHKSFLHARQDGLRQMAEIMRMQGEAILPHTLANSLIPNPSPEGGREVRGDSRVTIFTRGDLEEFALGSMARVFGPEFAIFEDRPHPRIPNGDLLLLSRIIAVEGQRGDFKSPASITSEYDVPAEPWFQPGDHVPALPTVALMEMALQPCGILSAYLGTVLLLPETNFSFRNLDGWAELVAPVDGRCQTVTAQARLLSSIVSSGTIIEKYSFNLAADGQVFYRGESTFGYFPLGTMRQTGLDGGKTTQSMLESKLPEGTQVIDLRRPEIRRAIPGLPDGWLDLLDEVRFLPGGGQHGGGLVYATRRVNPRDWFYACHFYQDPVMPGSLGVESMMRAMQVAAAAVGLPSRRVEPLAGQVMTWKYRGQVLQTHGITRVEIHLHPAEKTPDGWALWGDASLWADSIRIYEVKDAGIRLAGERS